MSILNQLEEAGKLPEEPKTNEVLKAVQKTADLKKNLTTHVARHSFAVLCAELGISKESTAELMGITVRTCTIYYKITNKKIDAEFKPWHSI